MNHDTLQVRLDAVVVAKPGDRDRVVRCDPETATFLDRHPPSQLRLLGQRDRDATQIEAVFSRVMTAEITAAASLDGWRVDVTGRGLSPALLPLKLTDVPPAADLPALGRLLSNARVLRHAGLVGSDGRTIPFVLEAGIASAPSRLWRADAEVRGPRLALRGWDWPIVVTLRTAPGNLPWTLRGYRPLRRTDGDLFLATLASQETHR